MIEIQHVPTFWLIFVNSLPLVAWLLGVVRGGERWKRVGGRCEALRSINVKDDRPVQHFDHKQAKAVFSGQGGKSAPRKEIGRLQGISGGFLIWWRSLQKSGVSRLVRGGLLYIWPGV